jgi:uncharacterized protein (TIGR03086 family)
VDDMTLLRGVLTKTADLVDAVPEDAWDRRTPCPDYDVRALLGHIVGWSEMFAAAAHGEMFDGDPTSVVADADAGARFRKAAARIVSGWESLGTDRSVPFTGGHDVPGPMVVTMTATEYLSHGWDLATGAGLAVPYSDEEAEETLSRAEKTLLPEYRGEGKPFGEIVPVPEGASAVDRFIGFVGRQAG